MKLNDEFEYRLAILDKILDANHPIEVVVKVERLKSIMFGIENEIRK